LNPYERDDLTHAITQIQAFYGKELDALQMKLWIRSLADLDPQKVKAALADYIKHGKYAPKPADIIDQCKNTSEQGRRSLPAPEQTGRRASPEVARAWSYVMNFWGMGDMFKVLDVSDEQSDRYIEICNRQAAASGNADAIPPECWMPGIWGCTRDEALSRAA
jgi:hypothetical protein